MDPSAAQVQQMSFGGGTPESVFSPVVLVLILLAGVLIWVLPRSKVIIPFIAAALLVPNDQVLLIGPFHFQMLRILLIFGFLRMLGARLTTGEKILSGGMNGIDKAFICLTIFGAVDGVLLWREWGEVIYQLGGLYTAFGAYFLLRYLIRDMEDAKRVLRVWACATVVIAGIMVLEQLTGRNFLYMAIGGVRAFAERVDTRGGAYRATGTFGHPILAGTFAGFSIPLFVGLWWTDRKARMYAGVGVVAAVIMVFAANSSTALSGALAGVIGLSFWFLRGEMRTIRWGIIATLVALQLYMTSPVWHIISDIDLSGGSSSYHRYQLVDQCIRHFSEWVLVGTKNFGAWGWNMDDLSNQYVATADTTGVIPLISLLAIIVMGFKYLGRARRAAEGERNQELFIWALGASLFANVIAFIGISYFDQTVVAWYALLAMISAVTLSARTTALESATMAKPGLVFNSSLATSPIRSGATAGTGFRNSKAESVGQKI